MPAPEEQFAKSVANQWTDQESPFRFCQVTTATAGVSATVDYGGTALTIPASSIYSAMPVSGDWVCIGINGTNRFILGVRL